MYENIWCSQKGWELIRMGIDRVGILNIPKTSKNKQIFIDRVKNNRVRNDRVRNDRVRNDRGLEMIGSR